MAITVQKAKHPSEATINVRIPASLKEQGDKVLKANHMTITRAVRTLYSFAAHEQKLPDFLSSDDEVAAQQEIERKQALMANLVGVIPKTVEKLDYRQALVDELVERYESIPGRKLQWQEFESDGKKMRVCSTDPRFAKELFEERA
jgi:antitoxin component of RelBE/YafQ-DinJ toxin-antitoxin module